MSAPSKRENGEDMKGLLTPEEVKKLPYLKIIEAGYYEVVLQLSNNSLLVISGSSEDGSLFYEFQTNVERDDNGST